MLWKFVLFASHFYCCWCQVTYQLDVKGEAQHGYYVTMKVGNPPQNIKLIIDTGSANFAVAVTPPLKGNQNYFHYSDSNTFQKLSSNIEIRYVEGEWSGFLASDLVSVSKNHSVKCAIACMTSIRNVFDVNSMFAGILGLAYPILAKPNSSVLPFFDTIRTVEKVDDVFSLSLCGPFFTSKDKYISCGKLHLGFISTLYYTDEMIYTPIVKEQLYEVTLTMIKVGHEQIAVDCKELNDPRSSIDTGTTQLLVPSSIYHKIILKIRKYFSQSLGQIDSTENIEVKWLNETAACVPKKYFKITLFPDLSISFYHTDNSSFDLVVSPELYLLPWQESSVENTCFILGIGTSNYGSIIGSTILKGYYASFDRSQNRIGFANSSFLQKQTSIVTLSHISHDTNYSNCKSIEHSNDSTSISVGTIILLLFILVLTIMLLYRLILWIQTFRLWHSDNRSDTSSLVGEEYKM